MAEVKKPADFREDLTNKLIEHLEQGEIPWRKGWANNPAAAPGLPVNAVSGKAYQGGNRLMLLMTGMDRGYTDNRWVTFNQSVDLGGSVQKGEKGTKIEYWDKMDFWRRKDVEIYDRTGREVRVTKVAHGFATIKDAKTNEGLGSVRPDDKLTAKCNGQTYAWKTAEAKLSLLFAKTFVVFNVEQCQGLGIEPKVEPAIPGNEKADSIIKGMRADGVGIQHAGNQAYYQPGLDKVTMPAPEQFESPEAYTATLLHELGHSTGHEQRMSRPLANAFGTPEYAREELVAELTSVFTAAETGLSFDDKNHAAYVGSWLKALQEDKNEIFRAAKDATKATDYLLEKAHEHELEVARSRGEQVEERKAPEPELEPEMAR